MGGVLCPAPNCGMGIFLDLDVERENPNHVECSECEVRSIIQAVKGGGGGGGGGGGERGVSIFE